MGNIIPCEGNDCGVCDIFKLISNIIKFAAFTIAAPLAGIIMAYGGFKLIISGGNEAERTKGMNAIQAAVWGILITFGAYVIVNAIIGGLAGNSISESWYQFPGCRIEKCLQRGGNIHFSITGEEGNDYEINIPASLLKII